MQPTPTVTAEDVVRVLRRDFPAKLVADLQVQLDAFAAAEDEWRGQIQLERVQMAVLKLAPGRADEVALYIKSAALDCRDVLAAAEYPGYMDAPSDMKPSVAQQIIDADWKQYHEWFIR